MEGYVPRTGRFCFCGNIISSLVDLRLDINGDPRIAIAVVDKTLDLDPDQGVGVYKCKAEHLQSSWLCSYVFLIDLCMLRTNVKVLYGANE